jgi:hypothetical protein
LVKRGRIKRIASVPRPTLNADQFGLAKCAKSSLMRGRNSLGTGPVLSPKKSLICVEAIRMAMPLVKPMTTMRGMKRTAAPNPVRPMITSRMPAITVTMAKPGIPKRSTMPATITTKAPVGPPIWVRDPPRAEMMKPATTAV